MCRSDSRRCISDLGKEEEDDDTVKLDLFLRPDERVSFLGDNGSGPRLNISLGERPLTRWVVGDRTFL